MSSTQASTVQKWWLRNMNITETGVSGDLVTGCVLDAGMRVMCQYGNDNKSFCSKLNPKLNAVNHNAKRLQTLAQLSYRYNS